MKLSNERGESRMTETIIYQTLKDSIRGDMSPEQATLDLGKQWESIKAIEAQIKAREERQLASLRDELNDLRNELLEVQ